jgi:hypothetical protein
VRRGERPAAECAINRLQTFGFGRGKEGGDTWFRRGRGGDRAALDSLQRRQSEGMGVQRRTGIQS